MSEEISYNDIKELCKRESVSDIIPILHRMKGKRKGSKRKISDVIKLAELSYEIVRNMELAGRFIVVSNNDGIREIIIKPEIVD